MDVRQNAKMTPGGRLLMAQRLAEGRLNPGKLGAPTSINHSRVPICIAMSRSSSAATATSTLGTRVGTVVLALQRGADRDRSPAPGRQSIPIRRPIA